MTVQESLSAPSNVSKAAQTNIILSPIYMMISIEHETDTAHRLSCHKGKCANLHGHRYKFVVSIEVKGTIEEDGFVDFYDLKTAVKEELDRIFDNGTILKKCPENGVK